MYDSGDECPGSDDDTHHCVDCGGLSWDDKGKNCSICDAYWCVSWEWMFVHKLCKHKRDKIDLEEDPICLQCYFSDPAYQCKIKECSQNLDYYTQKWIKHGESLISIGYTELTKNGQIMKLRAGFPRKLDGSGFFDLYSPDTTSIVFQENDTNTTFEGKDAMDRVIQHYNEKMRKLLENGYSIVIGDYGSYVSGIFARAQKPPKRDASPKRK